MEGHIASFIKIQLGSIFSHVQPHTGHVHKLAMNYVRISQLDYGIIDAFKNDVRATKWGVS